MEPVRQTSSKVRTHHHENHRQSADASATATPVLAQRHTQPTHVCVAPRRLFARLLVEPSAVRLLNCRLQRRLLQIQKPGDDKTEVGYTKVQCRLQGKPNAREQMAIMHAYAYLRICKY